METSDLGLVVLLSALLMVVAGILGWRVLRAPRLFPWAWRTETRPAAYAEPGFTYLCTSARVEARRVRRVISGWFRRYPRCHQERLARRFCSTDATSYVSSFFELYLHEICSRLGYRAEAFDSDVSAEKRPDFRLDDGNGSVFLEATLATEAALLPSSKLKVMDDFIDELNRRLVSPSFFVHVQEKGSPGSAPRVRKCAKDLELWLSRLDPSEVAETYRTLGYAKLPSWDFEHDGWHIRFVAQARKLRLRGRAGVRVIGTRSRGGGVVDRVGAIRKSLKSKATRYGDLGAPYVIAVNVCDEHSVDESEFDDALFGGTEVRATGDSLWIGPEGPRNRRVSAVLAASYV